MEDSHFVLVNTITGGKWKEMEEVEGNGKVPLEGNGKKDKKENGGKQPPRGKKIPRGNSPGGRGG